MLKKIGLMVVALILIMLAVELLVSAQEKKREEISPELKQPRRTDESIIEGQKVPSEYKAMFEQLIKQLGDNDSSKRDKAYQMLTELWREGWIIPALKKYSSEHNPEVRSRILRAMEAIKALQSLREDIKLVVWHDKKEIVFAVLNKSDKEEVLLLGFARAWPGFISKDNFKKIKFPARSILLYSIPYSWENLNADALIFKDEVDLDYEGTLSGPGLYPHLITRQWIRTEHKVLKSGNLLEKGETARFKKFIGEEDPIFEDPIFSIVIIDKKLFRFISLEELEKTERITLLNPLSEEERKEAIESGITIGFTRKRREYIRESVNKFLETYPTKSNYIFLVEGQSRMRFLVETHSLDTGVIQIVIKDIKSWEENTTSQSGDYFPTLLVYDRDIKVIKQKKNKK